MRAHNRHSGGFSPVEILVAMVIALLGTIIIFQVFSVSEGIKRTSTSGGDAQQYGALALFTLERDLRMAGLGLNNPALLGCTLRSYDELASPKVRPTFLLLPVVITAGATNADPDQITVAYGNSDVISAPAKITQNQIAATSAFRVSNRFGYLNGNKVVAVEPGKDCTLAEVTNLPQPPSVDSDLVNHDAGNYTNSAGNSTTARFNSAAGLGVLYTTNGSIYNLGNGAARNTYRVSSGQLVMDSMFSTAATFALADNIVQLKAQYGMDDGLNNGTVNHTIYAASDGTVDNYTYTATDWSKMLTVRLAVVARSALPEKPKVQGGPCDATTSAPAWAGGTLDLSAFANWACYRYRTFETTVPLRNLIWQQSS